jgi:Zn-dependent peptidase ImmA (M78 family)
MNTAKRKAQEVIEKYGTNLQDILDGEDIGIIEESMTGRLKELFFGDFIVLEESLSDAEKQELIAHALGHHFLHAGNHLAASLGTYSWDKLQERQADVFAAYLLMPKLNLTTRHFEKAISNVAEDFGVTESFAGFRLKLLEAYKA